MPRDWRLRSPQEVRILTLWRLTSSLWISKAYRSPVVAIRRNRVADRCCATASANACSHCALVRGSHDTWRATCELICNSQNRSMSDGTCSRSRTGHEFIQVPDAARRISRKASYAVTESSRPGRRMRKRRKPRWQRALRENDALLLSQRGSALRCEPGYLAFRCHFDLGPTSDRGLPSAHKRSRSTTVFRLIVDQRRGADLADAVSSACSIGVSPAWGNAIKPD